MLSMASFYSETVILSFDSKLEMAVLLDTGTVV